MPYVDLSQFKMHYLSHGEGDETLLLVHGNMGSARWWQKILPLVPEGYRVLAPDLRGSGESQHPAQGYSIEQFAQDLREFSEALNLKDFHLLGHSMGGQVVMRYAIQDSDNLKTLALLDSVPADGLMLNDTGRRLFKVMLKYPEVLKETVQKLCFHCEEDLLLNELYEDAVHCSPNIYLENPESMHNTYLIPELHKISCPVLLMHGKEDMIVPLITMNQTLKALPYADVVFFDNCGHAPMIEIPQEFMKVYLDFVQEYA